MYDTICYLGSSAHDFTEISAARKELVPSAELRFFTTAAELAEHVSCARDTERILVFVDTRLLDSEWTLVSIADGKPSVKLILLGPAFEPSEFTRARSLGVTLCLESPLRPEALVNCFRLAGPERLID